MSKRILALTWAAAVAAWGNVGFLLYSADVGTIEYPLHSVRLLYYVLIVLAPALTFFPLGRLMDLRTFGWEATLCWAGLLAMLTFVPPSTAGLPGYLCLLALLFGSAAAVFLPLGYLLGARLLTLRAHRRDTGRARREAYLASLFVVLSAAMNVGGFYSALNAALLLLILGLVESFGLARKPGTPSIE